MALQNVALKLQWPAAPISSLEAEAVGLHYTFKHNCCRKAFQPMNLIKSKKHA